MKDIVICTKNKGKIREFERLLKNYNVKFHTMSEMNIDDDVVEDGESFMENALIKAKTISKKYNVIALADDSGLCVDALNGAPGIYSARYAGDHDQLSNNELLLKNMEGVTDRGAHFTCALCLYFPNDEYLLFEKKSYGVITQSQIGDNGFGYDAFFYVPELKKTYAMMSGKEKDLHSHRAKAIRRLSELVDEDFNIKRGEANEHLD